MSNHRRGAFTLIELLVVVAIIGLLISMLLPSLAAAREQGKTVVCLAHLKDIGHAMGMYFSEHDDWFPFEKSNWPQTDGTPRDFPMTAFYYGGHPGRPGMPGDPTHTFDNEKIRDTFKGRAFNPYLFTDLYDKLETPEEALSPEGNARRLAMKLFACPSDVGGYYNSDTSGETNEVQPNHYRHGSSYDINYHFVWAWASSTGVGAYPAYSFSGRERRHYLERANNFLEKQREYNVSRFVILFEDPFDSALLNKWAKFGWHRKWQRHSFLFLDGHAANTFANVSQGRFGTGWKTSSGPWYNRSEDPDYQWKDLPDH